MIASRGKKKSRAMPFFKKKNLLSAVSVLGRVCVRVCVCVCVCDFVRDNVRECTEWQNWSWSSSKEKGYVRQKTLSRVEKREEFISPHARRKISFKGKNSLTARQNKKCPSPAVALVTLAWKLLWERALQVCVPVALNHEWRCPCLINSPWPHKHAISRCWV